MLTWIVLEIGEGRKECTGGSTALESHTPLGRMKVKRGFADLIKLA